MEQQTPQTTLTKDPRSGEALTVRRLYTQAGVHPFETVEWERRIAAVGSFRQDDVEFPSTWSQNATNIVAQKYFRGQIGSPTREHSVKQMIGRVSGTIADWGRERGYFASVEDGDAFEAELTYILLHQIAAFNSPVWFNVGFEEQPQCSACFILSVEDTMESILEWNTKEGRIFRGGSGSGINLSKIRGSMEPLAKGGTASGPVSFMRGADSWAGTIKSGGKTRRAAKMVVLDVDHPDIREFIWCKAKEEDKALALREAGFDMSIDGDGFHSIQYQNANNSVRVTDEFMHAVENDEDWHLLSRKTGEPVGEPIPARELMREIAEAAWRCADPGVQYDTTINQWHTSPVSGRINASNPCSEYMHVDDSACNLASLNLMKFRRPDGSLDTAKFSHAVDIVFLAQEIIVGPSSYPTEDDRPQRARLPPARPRLHEPRRVPDGERRRLRLRRRPRHGGGDHRADDRRGVPAVGADRGVDRHVRPATPRTATPTTTSCGCTATRRTRSRTPPASTSSCSPTRARAGTRRSRSATVTATATRRRPVLAPTGTISFLMDCDTTGVEPDFALVKRKELVGGGTMTIVNRTVPMALRTLGYTDPQVEQIEAYVSEHGTIIGAPELRDEHLPVFDVAVGDNAVSARGHITMMGAVQPFLSGAISKTVNMPETSTVDDIAEAYVQAWRLGIKALAIYRDGSKTAQALRTTVKATVSDEAAAVGEELFTAAEVEARVAAAVEDAVTAATAKAGAAIGPARKRMPRERKSLTHKFSLGGHEGYITAGLYDDGTVGEIFLTDIGKEGSTLRGMMNSFATAISIALQYGVPLETLVRKFAYMRFEPEGITTNPEIPFAKSMPDYIMRWLASRFLDADVQEDLGILTPEVRAKKTGEDTAAAASGDTAGPTNGGTRAPSTQAAAPAPAAEAQPAASAFTDSPPVIPARMVGLDVGPACTQCGGMMQRTGACYTCSSCGYNTGCG